MKFWRIIGGKKQINKFQRFGEEKDNKTNNDFNRYNFLRINSTTIGSFPNRTIYDNHHKTISDKNIILKMNEIKNDYPEKYYSHYLKSDIIKFLKNISALFLHIIIIICYISSIKACPDDISLNECIEKIDINFSQITDSIFNIIFNYFNFFYFFIQIFNHIFFLRSFNIII